ncbi:hypothetical protein PV387_40100 [Streptomyces sp. ME02-6987-2C]|uniref:hypothetical protein n=1 Tax=unclassified Streptomyces TaxID=2593676 RepID=UPI0029BB57CF|nr:MULTISPECIES: hypothetical protein [unclassified Streptomyces]MDX3372117.1 hypothetical protein [Streptomyces sp. ME02-6987-2C]MDX3426373.1 hypothetical protein [Streptomyces sp. ME02-6985-2c]
MNPAHSRHQLQHMGTALASAGLIRLISEIDDHGAIPVRALARTLTDLSTAQIRQAVTQADALSLLDRSHTGLGLTEAGRDLADLYDHVARWARHHNYPHAVSTFAERIRRVFALLADPTTTQPGQQDSEADASLHHIQRLLTEWADAHHQPQPQQSAYGIAA